MVEATSQLLLAFLLCAISITEPATSTDMPPQVWLKLDSLTPAQQIADLCLNRPFHLLLNYNYETYEMFL